MNLDYPFNPLSIRKALIRGRKIPLASEHRSHGGSLDSAKPPTLTRLTAPM